MSSCFGLLWRFVITFLHQQPSDNRCFFVCFCFYVCCYFQIARAAGLETFETELFEYFQVHMASDVISLQGSAGSVTVAPLGLEVQGV